jgi:diguanylate cyclase (GGDEF)-like protein
VAAALASYAAYSLTGLGGLGGSTAQGIFEDWVYNGLMLVAACLCLARAALASEDRPAWLVRARVRRFYVSLWLDGVIGALALAALAAALVFPALLASTGSPGSNVLADLSYPVADLLLVGLAVGVVAMTGWRPGRVLGFVAGGLVLGALADGFSLWWAATGHSTARTALDWLWPASALMLAFAAWQPVRPSAVVRVSGLRSLVLPVGFAATSLALLLYSRNHAIDDVAFVLASAAVIGAILRMGWTFAENLRIVEDSRREALTDALTGLGNRRRLLLELEESLEVCSPRSPQTLLIFDLDGFKRYNDTFGHPAGDALLARLGSNLREAASGFGEAYRLGGDEFCALLRGDRSELDTIVGNAVAGLSDHGAAFSVTTSYGAVALPDEADNVSEALRIADERLYAHKGDGRRGRETQLTRDVLKQVLQEREPGLWDHLTGVASLALPVGRRLGLDEAALEETARAAELHDIGKLAIPDAILDKPGPLDELERTMMRQHTLVGERILRAAPPLEPVSKLVRSSHEHYDGHGYPDGLAGEGIPLGARIIAVCDAYEAMTTDRPYRSAMPPGEAVRELRSCAGAQFDPEVVDAFCAEIDPEALAVADSRIRMRVVA